MHVRKFNYSFFLIVMLLTPFGCQNEAVDNTKYSLSIMRTDYDEPFEGPKYKHYHSDMVCVRYMSLVNNQLTIYENIPGSIRKIDTIEVSPKKAKRFISLVELIDEQPNEGEFMDSTIYCGFKCCDGAEYLITTITNNTFVKRNFSYYTLSRDEVLAMKDLLRSFKNKTTPMAQNKFISEVLEHEQYANLQNPYIPPPPPIHFTPPSN